MPTENQPSGSEKIEIILIGQIHSTVSVAECDNFDANDPKHAKIIYSQLKIMQLVPLYPNAALITEGNLEDTTEMHRDTNLTIVAKKVFPEYEALHTMAFDALNPTQKKALVYWPVHYHLFRLGVIPATYQSTKAHDYVASDLYLRSYRQTLSFFPMLVEKGKDKSRKPRYLKSVDELKEYYRFHALMRLKNPALFLHREREALDFALLAAKKSRKKQVIIVFGSGHKEGFLHLLNTEYQDRMVLKEYIDSSEGFNGPDQRKILDLHLKEANDFYKLGQYKEASEGFAKVVAFWNATPNSTPNKLQTRLSAEFNLGSSLFKWAEMDETVSYEQSLPHLEQAAKLAKEIYGETNSQKYKMRHSESLRRYSITTSFSAMPSRIGRLIAAYSEEPETPSLPSATISA